MNKRQGEIIILGIESSCDDTSAAILRGNKILANITAGQEVHQQYGGVVPELASRAHQQHIVPVVDAAIKKAGISKKDIDAIAFTIGPGLQGSLLVGSSFAKSMALALGLPLIAVNHMQAHILAHFIEDNNYPVPLQFPFLCLTVSGGHTQIVRVDSHLEMKVLGETIDDAAGEAFDKAAKILGLPYPGGPLVDRYAKEGDPLRFEFPAPKIEGLNFSFSGIKTAFLYFIRDHLKENPGFIAENLNDICASIQHSIVRILLGKLKRAAKEQGIRQVAIAGGVSANSCLRSYLREEAGKQGWDLFLPKFEYCTDNAAMIAITGHYKLLAGELSGQEAAPLSRLKI
jgi:N6-L-threonylcarbamoyladenine synthase